MFRRLTLEWFGGGVTFGSCRSAGFTLGSGRLRSGSCGIWRRNRWVWPVRGPAWWKVWCGLCPSQARSQRISWSWRIHQWHPTDTQVFQKISLKESRWSEWLSPKQYCISSNQRSEESYLYRTLAKSRWESQDSLQSHRYRCCFRHPMRIILLCQPIFELCFAYWWRPF